MHQILSFISSIILSTSNWIIILLIISFIIKNPRSKKICRVSALIIFIIFGNSWLLNQYAKHWQPAPRDVSKDKPYSCGILLGGFGSSDENGNGFFNRSCDRFLQTFKLYKTGKIDHILISGGNGKTEQFAFNEAAWAKNEFISMGVPDSVIIQEDRSNNTADNTLNTKAILDSVKLNPPYLLITSAFHMPRASLLFKKHGIDAVAFPCSYFTGKDGIRQFSVIPNFDTLTIWDYYLKEIVGYCFYIIR